MKLTLEEARAAALEIITKAEAERKAFAEAEANALSRAERTDLEMEMWEMLRRIKDRRLVQCRWSVPCEAINLCEDCQIQRDVELFMNSHIHEFERNVLEQNSPFSRKT